MVKEIVQLRQTEISGLNKATVEVQTQLETVVRGINPVIVPILLSARRTAKMYAEQDLTVINPADILEEADCWGVHLESTGLIEKNLECLFAMETAFDAYSKSYAALLWRKHPFLRQKMPEEELVDYTRALVRHVFSWKVVPEEFISSESVDPLIIRVFGWLNKIPQRLAAERPYLISIDELEEFITDPYNLNPERIIERSQEAAELSAFIQTLDSSTKDVLREVLEAKDMSLSRNLSYTKKQLVERALRQNPRLAGLINARARQKNHPLTLTRENFGITDASGTSVFINLTPRQSIWLILYELTIEQRRAVLEKLGYIPLPSELGERRRIAESVYGAKKVLLSIRQELNSVPRFEGQLQDVLDKPVVEEMNGSVSVGAASPGKKQRQLRGLLVFHPEFLDRLNGRQQQVGRLLAEGRSVSDIVNRLRISPATVYWFIWSIRQTVDKMREQVRS